MKHSEPPHDVPKGFDPNVITGRASTVRGVYLGTDLPFLKNEVKTAATPTHPSRIHVCTDGLTHPPVCVCVCVCALKSARVWIIAGFCIHGFALVVCTDMQQVC